MKSFLAAFKKFITRGNVIDMAVGVAVGSAFTAIVTAFTKGIISPVIALLSKAADLATMKWVIREAVVETVDGVETVVTAEVAIMYGMVLQAIIDFLMIAFVLFCIIRFVTAFMNRANKMSSRVKKALRTQEQIEADEKAQAEAEAAKAAEEAAKAAEEAAVAAKLAEEQRRIEAQEKAQADTVALLGEIRTLLQNKSN